MINKNICEEIWLCFLDTIYDKTYKFNKEYYTSYYRKGEYVQNIIIGITINAKGNLKFETKEENLLGWDRVDFSVIDHITKDTFPNLDCEEVHKIQNTIVYLRRLRSDLDLCYNSLLGNEYKEYLDNLDDDIINFINIGILNIIDYSKNES